MKKPAITFFAFIFLTNLSFGQSIERFVTGSTGNFKSAGNYSISSTTGEAVVPTFEMSYILTQGFQQPDYEISTGTDERQSPDVVATIYPNPVSGWMVLSIRSGDAVNYHYEITDVLGRTVSLYSVFEQKNDNARIVFDMSGLASGVYFLHLSSGKDKSFNHLFKFSKIN